MKGSLLKIAIPECGELFEFLYEIALDRLILLNCNPFAFVIGIVHDYNCPSILTISITNAKDNGMWNGLEIT